MKTTTTRRRRSAALPRGMTKGDVLIVVHGPPASGKTLNAEVLQKTFGARMVFDEASGPLGRVKTVSGCVVVLTNDAERVAKLIGRKVKAEWWTIEQALAAAEALGYEVRRPGQHGMKTQLQPGELMVLADGDDKRWAEDVLPLVAKMMRLRGYLELRLELTPRGCRYEVVQEVSKSHGLEVSESGKGVGA